MNLELILVSKYLLFNTKSFLNQDSWLAETLNFSQTLSQKLNLFQLLFYFLRWKITELTEKSRILNLNWVSKYLLFSTKNFWDQDSLLAETVKQLNRHKSFIKIVFHTSSAKKYQNWKKKARIFELNWVSKYTIWSTATTPYETVVSDDQVKILILLWFN